MFAIAKDEGEPVLWDFLQPDCTESHEATTMLEEALAAQALIYAHNYQFELAVSHYRLVEDVGVSGTPIKENYRCTQAMCRKAAIPESLGKAAAFLGLDQQKENIGKDLIGGFSKQRDLTRLHPPVGAIDPDTILPMKRGGFTKGKKPKNRKSASPVLDAEILWDWQVKVGSELMTVRKAWELFKDYCRQDVRTEREVHRKLHKFELTGQALKSFLFNLSMNDKGVPVNITALKHAQRLIKQYEKRAHLRFKNMTGLRPTQGKKFKPWLQERGYFRDDLQAITVEDFLQDYGDLLTEEAHAALSLYQLLNFAALAKVPAMLNSACDDGYVRGTLMWHGARTGRATGKIIQPQNFKKATMQTMLAYQMICDGCSLEDLMELWGSPLEVIACCARHFIQLPGTDFYDADFVGVEARLTPWCVDDVVKLQSILDGVDPYKRIATMVFDVPYEEVTKAQRTISKPVELGCCYGVGGQGLQNGLAGAPYNTKVSLKECKRIVKIYRDNHPETVAGWREIEDAVKLAIKEGKSSTILNGRVKVGQVKTAGLKYFVLQLPSGRRLYYPSPEIKPKWVEYTLKEMAEDEWKAKQKGYWRDEIRFMGQRPNNAGWGRIATYGSRLFENIVQAMGADLLDEGCISAVEAGFDIFLIVHDQALCYAHPVLTLKQFEEAFCSVGDWAATFPLAADGAVVPFYMKEID